MGPGDALEVYGEEKVIVFYRVSKFGPPSMVQISKLGRR
jgi:hypothetical protein